MKKFFYIFIIATLVACSSDNGTGDSDPSDDSTDDSSGGGTDDGQGQTGDLVIAKVTATTYPGGNPPIPYQVVTEYDEQARITREVYGQLPDPTPGWSEWNYDSSGRLTSIDYYGGDGTFYGDITYEFSPEDRVVRRIDNAAESETIVTSYTHKENEVIALDERSGDIGIFTFDAEGRLLRMEKQLSLSGSQPFGIDMNYDNLGNVRRIDHWSEDGVDYRHIVDYDAVENPLHEFYKNYLRPYLYLTRPDQYDHENFLENFTPNNYRYYTNTGGTLNDDDKTITYNESGYPVSATVLRSGELWKEITYEYQ